MNIIQKAYEVGNDEYYKLHLTIINTILPIKLTDKEIQVLSTFMALDKAITQEDSFNVIARKKVRNTLLLSPGGLSNHLKSMIKKGFLVKNDITKRIVIKEFLLPKDDAQGYRFKIVKK